MDKTRCSTTGEQDIQPSVAIAFNTYQHRPTEVEALRWTGRDIDGLNKLVGRLWKTDMHHGTVGVYDRGSSAYRVVAVGDWIVRTSDGKVRPMKHDEFVAAYALAPQTVLGTPGEAPNTESSHNNTTVTSPDAELGQ